MKKAATVVLVRKLMRSPLDDFRRITGRMRLEIALSAMQPALAALLADGDCNGHRLQIRGEGRVAWLRERFPVASFPLFSENRRGEISMSFRTRTTVQLSSCSPGFRGAGASTGPNVDLGDGTAAQSFFAGMHSRSTAPKRV